MLPTFDEVWVLDTEYRAPRGETPEPVCLAARELVSGRRIELWHDELARMTSSPFDPRALVVSYQAMAEVGVFLALGWEPPPYVCCCYAEFRRWCSGCVRTGEGQFGQVGALRHFGLPAMESAHKEAMRDLIIDRSWNDIDEHRCQIQRYCMDDVDDLARLFVTMRERGAIDLPRALLRGRFQCAAAAVERRGYPIDVELFRRIVERWEDIELGLIRERDNLGVYDGATLVRARWLAACSRLGIAYPCIDGTPILERKTREKVVDANPVLRPVHELIETLGQMRAIELPIGGDGRVRTPVMPFGTSTGRCAPSTTKNVFGASSWVRRLVVAPPETVVFQYDYGKQEPWIGAALSGDDALLHDLRTGDLYLAFAIRTGMAPDGATKDTHDAVRSKAKSCVLGIGYHMGPESLAARIGCQTAEARAILAAFRRAYSVYSAWCDAMARTAMATGEIQTMLGWRQVVYSHTRFRSLVNFPQQATGAEMLRLATIFAVEDGLLPAALVHDCIVFEAPIGALDEHIAGARKAMTDASRSLIGLEIPLDGQAVVPTDMLARLPRDEKGRPYLLAAGERLPASDRLQSGKGGDMWSTIMKLLDS